MAYESLSIELLAERIAQDPSVSNDYLLLQEFAVTEIEDVIGEISLDPNDPWWEVRRLLKNDITTKAREIRGLVTL